MIGRSEQAIRKQPCPAVWSTEQTGCSAKFWVKKSKGKEEKNCSGEHYKKPRPLL